MTKNPRILLRNLFDVAVAAAHPSTCLRPYLPESPKRGRLTILAAGKSAGAMTEIAEKFYRDLDFPAARIGGIAVARTGYARPTQIVEMMEAGHPVPDKAGLAAAARALTLADEANADDLVLVLISGGASANWIAPAEGLTLAEKQAVTRALLRSGASIGEINTLRKHLSRIKGGRLAKQAYPARIVTLAISDVPADDPAVIGSGPTIADPSTLEDSRAIVAQYRLALPDTVGRVLADPRNESPKPGDPVFSQGEVHVIARSAQSFHAVSKAVCEAGYECIFLGDQIQGEARDVATAHAKLAREIASQGRRAIIISGGELTVTLRGQGEGGPNQEYALSLVQSLEGAAGIVALAGDTDGTDGGQGRPDAPAGAFADATSAARARAHGLDPTAFLADNNSTPFFAPLGDLLRTGPTFTNVNDFRAILIDGPKWRRHPKIDALDENLQNLCAEF